MPDNVEELLTTFDYWVDSHPDFPYEEWQDQVQNNNTRLGYWDWVVNEMENEGD